MIPAYEANKLYILFFVTFIAVNLYVFMGVFLAVVYNSYKFNLKEEVKASVNQKRQLLKDAFDLVKTKGDILDF